MHNSRKHAGRKSAKQFRKRVGKTAAVESHEPAQRRYPPLMPCYHPMAAWRTNGVISFRELLERKESTEFLNVACGKCIGCRKRTARDWAIRCQLEQRDHLVSTFVTLTYDEKHLPPTLQKAHLSGWVKRLRSAVHPHTFRFFASGEYGEKTDVHITMLFSSVSKIVRKFKGRGRSATSNAMKSQTLQSPTLQDTATKKPTFDPTRAKRRTPLPARSIIIKASFALCLGVPVSAALPAVTSLVGRLLPCSTAQRSRYLDTSIKAS